MPVMVSRTASPPFWADSRVSLAARADASAFPATWRTDSVSSSMEALASMASRVWPWAPAVLRSIV